jgi:hypothetical protein
MSNFMSNFLLLQYIYIQRTHYNNTVFNAYTTNRMFIKHNFRQLLS